MIFQCLMCLYKKCLVYRQLFIKNLKIFIRNNYIIFTEQQHKLLTNDKYNTFYLPYIAHTIICSLLLHLKQNGGYCITLYKQRISE